MVSQESWALLGFEEDRMCKPILTTTLFLAEDTYSSEELVDQQPVLLKVMDTADQVSHCGGDDQLDHDLTTTGLQLSHSSHPQDGPGNCERYLCWASAFLVVYSIDNRKSFEGCQRYLEVLALHARGCQRRCPVLLLGNKLDMEQYRYRARGKVAALRGRELTDAHPSCWDAKPKSDFFTGISTPISICNILPHP